METPDAASLRLFFEGARFRSGALRGRWQFLGLAFPYAIVAIQCGDGRYVELRFECTGYVQALPTAQVWDSKRDEPMPFAYWPRGEKRINAVFRPDWKAGSSLYIPCDRNAIDGHNDWVHQHPEMVWNPSMGLMIYLEAVHSLLQSSDFTMVNRDE
jgi:hypothetical protein